MPRNRHGSKNLGITSFAWIALATLAGCQTPLKVVSVDVAKAFAPEPLAVNTAFALNANPEGAVKVEGFPAIPARVLHSKLEGTEVNPEKVVEAFRERAYKNLLARLTTTYVEAVDARQSEAVAMFRDRSKERWALYRERVRTLFERYATERGPLIARLAFLVGFPDPDPHSQQATPSGNRNAERSEEAKSVRRNLAKVDKRYEEARDAMFSAARSQDDAELTKLTADLQRERDAARARAQREATRAASERTSAMLKPIFLGASQSLADVPATPGTTIQAIGVPSPIASTESKIGHNDAEQRDVELRVWAALHGYRLGKPGPSVEDKTREFVEWRSSRHPGP